MAIRFNSDQNKVPLESLNINDTFVFHNRIGLVIEVKVLNMDFDSWETQRFWVDLSTGRDFMKDEYNTQMDGTEFVTPIDLSVSIIKKQD